MPWIFQTLLLANVAYFVWGIFQDTSIPHVRVAPSQVIPADKRLALLSERPDLLAQAVANPPVSSDAGPAVVPSGPACYSVGPFANDGSPNRFALKMQARHFTTRIDVLEKDSMDYWVFVPALVNRDQAEEKLRDLKRNGVADAFIVDQNPFTNAISLGHFSQSDLAQAYKDKMVAQNVPAEMRELPRTGQERWVYVAPGVSKIDVKDAIDAALSGGNTSANRQPTPCEG
jgi:hypothetical protein